MQISNMQTSKRTQVPLLTSLAAAAMATASALVATGCGEGFHGSSTATGTASVVGTKMQGSVLGGQQPVVGATIQLYAANLTGYNANSYPLLTTAVTTSKNGSFSITGDYACPSPVTPVYLTATGGAAGTNSTNTSLVLMAALGACGNLTANTFINMNELTTVASGYALAPFMTSPTQLSTSATNTTGMTIAFASVNKLVNIGTGGMPGSALPSGATEPTAKLNTLADILAACVNSATGSPACTSLFASATPIGGTTPGDTLTAILNIAKNPGLNVTALFNLTSGTAPFQPALTTVPTDFTVAIKYKPSTTTFSVPSAAAIDASGDLWVTNSGNNTIVVLNSITASPSVYTGTLSGPAGIAFDASGNAWVPNKTNSTLSVFTSEGVGATALSSNLTSPSSVAVDGQGLIWVTNFGANSVTVVTPSGTRASSSTVLSTGGVSAPLAVAINPH